MRAMILGRTAAHPGGASAKYQRVRTRLRQLAEKRIPHLLPSSVAAQRVALFRGLAVLDESDTERLAPEVLYFEQQYASDVLISRLSTALLTVLSAVPLAALLIWLAPLIADLILGTDEGAGLFTSSAKNTWLWNVSSRSVPLTVVCGLFGVLIAYLALRSQDHPLPRSLRRAGLCLFWIAAATVVWYCCRRLGEGAFAHQDAWSRLGFSLIIFGLGALVAGTLAFVRVAEQSGRARASEAHPCAAIVHNLLALLEIAPAERDPRWNGLEWRRQAISRLERIASAFDPHLGTSFACGSKSVDTWIARRCTEFAGSVQELAQMVFAPSKDTPSLLSNRIRGTLACVLDGCWDALPRSESAAAAEPLTRVQRLRPVLRRLVVVLAPGAFLIIYRSTPLAAAHPVNDSTAFSIAMLTLTGLLTLLNPKLDAEMKATSAVTDFFKLTPPAQA